MIRDLIERHITECGSLDLRAGRAHKWGVTLALLEEWRGYPQEVNDLALLTKDEAREIYEMLFYVGARIDRLPHEIQPVMLDMAFLIGRQQSVRILQSVVTLAGRGLNIDGTINQATVVACNVICSRFYSESLAHQIAKSWLAWANATRGAVVGIEDFHNSHIATRARGYMDDRGQ